MPTGIPAAQVEVRFTVQGQKVENVFHVEATVPLTQTEAEDIADIVDNWVKGALRNNQSTQTVYRALVVRDVNDGGLVYERAGDNLANANSDVGLPNHVTFAVKKNTAKGGRHFRGRFFHIGLLKSQVSATDPNLLTDAGVAAIVAVYEGLRAGLATGGHTLKLGQHLAGPPPVLVGVETVTSISAGDNIIDSQRRRLPGRGS